MADQSKTREWPAVHLLALLLLPLQAAWFAGVAALWGLWQVLSRRQGLVWGAFAALLGLGAWGQWLSATAWLEPLLKPPAFVATGAGNSNLMGPLDLAALHGWNQEDGAGPLARRAEAGFWRLAGLNPVSGRVQTEFFADRWYPLQPGQTYTQSFYLRHDGQRARFTITFFTPNGHHPVTTQMEPVAPGVWRVWASYTAQPGDTALRAIDFFPQDADFSYLEVGWAQLEAAARPSPYQVSHPPSVALGPRLGAWAGTVLLGWLALQAGAGWARRVRRQWAAGALLGGLALHLAYALGQLSQQGEGARVVGWTLQPNFLGHMGVMVAALAWLLGGRWAGAVGLGLAGLLVWASGSRAAFWALGLLLLAWWWGLGRARWLALIPLGLLGVGLLERPELLGRLQDAAKLDTSAQARLQIWQVALEALRQFPWGGVGWGNFPLYYLAHMPAGALEIHVSHAHNLLLHLGAEGGVLALLGLALWLGGLGVALWRRRAWRGGVLLAVALALNLLDQTFFNAGVFYPLCVGLGWVLAAEPLEARLDP